jgi:hypothetical protein
LTIQQTGRVEIVREFVLKRKNTIARPPIQASQQNAERRGSVRNKCDVVRCAVDQPADLPTQAFQIVEPI